MPHSSGVRWMSVPFRSTRFAARSIEKSSVITTGSSSVGVLRRRAARKRASSSPIENGLVT